MSTGPDVSVDVGEIVERLRAISRRDRNVPMASVAASVIAAIDDLIDSEGAAGTQGKWIPSQRAQHVGGKTLQRTGLLANMQYVVEGQTVTIRSPAEYAGWHVDGTSRMPRRDFFALRFPELLDQIAEDVLQEYTR